MVGESGISPSYTCVSFVRYLCVLVLIGHLCCYLYFYIYLVPVFSYLLCFPCAFLNSFYFYLYSKGEFSLVPTCVLRQTFFFSVFFLFHFFSTFCVTSSFTYLVAVLSSSLRLCFHLLLPFLVLYLWVLALIGHLCCYLFLVYMRGCSLLLFALKSTYLYPSFSFLYFLKSCLPSYPLQFSSISFSSFPLLTLIYLFSIICVHSLSISPSVLSST